MSGNPDPAVALRQRLRAALPVALKARDRTSVTALRSALAAIDNAEAVDSAEGADNAEGADTAEGADNAEAVDRAEAVHGAVPGPGRLAIEQTPVGVGTAEVARRVLTGDQVERIVRAEVAEREAAAREYDRAGRSERAERLRREAAVLSGYLTASA